MKKILLKALYALGFVSSINFINAQCSLDQVGAPNYSVTSQLSDMTVSPLNNTLYTISYNTGAGGKFFLHSATTANSWTPVASLSGTTSIKPIVSVSKTGKVYIVIKDNGAGEVGKVFYESAGSFIQIGGPFSGANKVSDLSIAFNSLGEEYVAYTDITNGNLSTVKKWNGSAWIAVGSGTVSTGPAYYNSLIIDKNDNPVLAFEDMDAGNKVNVMKFNGTTWNSMITVGTNPTNSKLKLGQNGDYYVGYTESTGSVVVQRYNGSVWGALGSPVTAMSFGANLFDLDLDPNDMPYFICQNNTSFYAAAFKYTGVPTWSNVIGGNISSVTSVNLNIGTDKTGSPYFFYVDQPGNMGLNVKTITSPISISTQPVSVSRCNGQSGSFSVGTVGGIPTSYQWQTLGSGTYTNSSAPYTNVTTANLAFTANTSMNQNQVRCVVNVGCKNIISNTPTLTVVTLSATTSSTNPTCFNTGDGAINAIVSGGVSPYTYTWSPVGGNTPNPTGLYWNTYTLTSADLNGCAITKTVALTSPPSISTSFSGNMNICSGANTTLTITASGGTPGYTYSWTPGGSLSTTTGSVVIANPGTTQTYNVSVTDALGCVATDTVMVNVTAAPILTVSANSTICAGSIATINVSGAHTYTWNPGNLVGALQNVNPASTTIYTVVGTNTLSGCSATSNVTVTVNSLPTVNAGPSRTLTCANTSTTLAGSTTGGIAYSWTGPSIIAGGTTLNPTINAPGTYDLTVTSAFGCSAGPSPVNVFQNTTPPSPTASASGSLNCATTTITLTGGPAGQAYLWSGPGITGSTTTQNTTANAPGNYTLLVTSSINGCTNTAITNVIQNVAAPNPFASSSGTITCATTTVALTALPASGVTYLWSGPGTIGSPTSQTTSVNAGGNYTLAITSLTNGCSSTFPIAVSQNTTPPSPTASNTGTLTCTTLTVPLTGSPGTGVTYLWSGPGVSGSTTTQNTSANAPGIYTLTVVNSINGCSANATTVVSQNVTPPTVSATNSSTLTCSTTTANVFGTGGGTYNWSGPGIASGGTTSSPVITSPGCYIVNVTAVNGCTATATTCITQNTIAPTTNTTVSGTLNCTLTSVNASATTTTTPVTYNWTGTGITSATNISTITVNAPGAKNYTVTNTSNGCITTGSLNVTQNLLSATPTATVTGTVTCLSNTVQLSGNPAAGVTYTWAAPGGSSISSGVNTQNAIGNGPGTYTLFVTMISSGCSNSKTVTATQNTTTPFANAGVDQSLTCASPTVTLSGSSTPSSCTPVWAGGVASGSNSFNATASAIGDYTLTVTNPSNGCSATDIVQVTANAGIPPLSTSATNTLNCTNTTATVIATTTVTTVMYVWAGPGIVSGGATANAIVNQPGLYTVTITNTMTGCSASANVTVSQDITLPTVTIVSSPSVICSGNSSILTANGAVTYTWSTAQTTSSISVSPITTDSYTVNGTGTNGCTNSAIETITVNATPVLSITGNTNICNGSTSTLTGSGATSYTWDSGVNTTTISVTPTVTTTYTLTGDNGNGCSSLLPVTVSIIPNKAITGVITSTTGPTGGDLTLYRYTSFLSQWDSITTVPLSTSYSFSNIDSALYVIRAIPTATNIQVTYADSAISWQDATIITHGCTNNTTQNIKLIPLETFTAGPGQITGTVYEDYGFGSRMSNQGKPMIPGGPIGGIIVKGGKNPGGAMMVQTITSTTPGSEGTYTLTGLPLNSGTDSYFVLVDIPGLDTNGTYHVVVSSGNTTFNGLDFKVDSMYINPIGSVTGILTDNSVLDHKISLFPNPASQNFKLEYELVQSANVEIELYDMVGHKLKTIIANSFEEKNKYSHSVNIEDLSAGVYFVKLKINHSETNIKLITN